MAEKPSFFNRLQKLLSTAVLIRDTGDDKLKVIDIAKVQSRSDLATNRVIDRYTKAIIPSRTYGFDYSHVHRGTRLEIYRDYEQMDMHPILSSALEIFAEEASMKNLYGNVLEIQSENSDVVDSLSNLFYDVLNIEFNLFPWIRNLVKYGDVWLKLDITEEIGITNGIMLSPYGVQRLENTVNPEQIEFTYDPALGNYMYGSTAQTYQNYEIAHFRLLSDSNYLPYGRSMLEQARTIWKQTCLAGNSNIWTIDGYKQIRNIIENDIVKSYDYNSGKLIETRVKNAIKTGTKEVYEIRTAHRLIKATEDHMFLTSDGDYKRVDELSLNDSLIIVSEDIDNDYRPKLSLDKYNEYFVKFDDDYYNEINKEYSNKCEVCGKKFGRLTGNHLHYAHGISKNEYIEKYDINKHQTKLLNRNGKTAYNDAILICEKFGLDKSKLKIYYGSTHKEIVYETDLEKYFREFVRFFGFMLGDGWIRKNTGIAFSLGTRLDKSMKYVDFLKNIKLDYNIEHGGESRAQCVSSSRYFAHLMEKLGFITGTHNKVVPTWVFKLSNVLKKEFILGFADADGCDLTDTEFVISGINEKLITDMRILAQQSGLMTNNIVVNVPKTDINYWGGDSVNNLYGFKFSLHGVNNKFTKKENNNYFEKIRKIELVGIEDVYDIEVDNDLHNFVADGLVAHNCLLQDAMLIHKIMRAPERRIYYLDVGNIPANEVEQYIQQVMAKTKKTPYMDESTGQYNLKFNLMNMLEDIYVPHRGDKESTRIDTLQGLTLDFKEELDFLMGQVFAAIRIPKAFLSYDENIEGRATLTTQDIRFARTIERIQRIVESELYKIAMVHLYAQGFDANDLVNFELSLTPSSILYEQERNELLSNKIDMVTRMKESKLISNKFIYEEIFHFSETEWKSMQNDIIDDLKFAHRLGVIEESGFDPIDKLSDINVNDGTQETSEPESPESAGENELPEMSGEEEKGKEAKPEEGGEEGKPAPNEDNFPREGYRRQLTMKDVEILNSFAPEIKAKIRKKMQNRNSTMKKMIMDNINSIEDAKEWRNTFMDDDKLF